MNEIVTVPNRVTQAGLDFSYAVWTQGTKITLCNVTWDANYKDVWNMEKPEDFDKYIKENGMAVTEVSSVQYIKANEPVRLNIPFNAANRFNYMKVENPLQPIQGDKRKVFYYFINDVQYIAPNTTQFNIMLDVWTTWLPSVTLGQCYVERGHVLMATNNASVDKYYLDMPEGFDIGSEYQTVELGKFTANNTDIDLTNPDNGDYSKRCGVIIVSTVSLDADPGDVNSPNLETSSGSTTNSMPNGAEIYYIENLSSLPWLFKGISKFPWVSQGIISITIVPLLDKVKGPKVRRYPGVTLIKLESYESSYIKNVVPSWRRDIANYYGDDKELKKLYTAPYTYIELTSFNGQNLVLKPQYIADSVTDGKGNRVRKTFFEDTPLRIVFGMHAIPPNPRLSYYCMSYLLDEDYGHAGGISNFPLTSIVNNGYMAYMASNAHGIAYQYQNADWTQQRAMAAAQLGYNQSTAAMGLTNDLANQSINNAGQMRDLNNSVAGSRALLGGVNSVVNGAGQALGGNIVGGFLTAGMGVVNSAADYAITTDQNNQSTAIQQSLMASNATSRINNAGYNRDTNMEFANYAAQGDYANAIGQINAKVQDAKLTSPTVSGQSGGDGWGINMFAGYWIRIRAKILTPNARKAITLFWRRYGYAANLFYNFDRFDINDKRNGNERLNCMTHFTYWKLKELYLTSSDCPELYRKTIRGIFEKGVTVWKDPRNIGKPNVLNDNKPNVPGWYI